MEKITKILFPAFVGLGGILVLFELISLEVCIGILAVLYAAEKIILSK